ncbi:MAG: hypothetical protein K8H75_07495 [Sulfuricella sp.]|nr:hypothetical protein [Sulfuricella sp.]
MNNFHWPALLGKTASAMLALQHQLERSQWLDAKQILHHQLNQVGPLLAHAYQTVPFYSDHYRANGFLRHAVLTPDNWGNVPIVTRKQIQEAGASMVSQAIPAKHGKTHSITTSGSTGMPITVSGTEQSNFFWQTLTLREHLWHGRDFLGKMAVIRRVAPAQALPPHGEVYPGWGASVNMVYPSGQLALLNITASVDQQLAWLQQQNPSYILTYPSNLLALAHRSMQTGVSLPNLKEVRTLGEIVGVDVRAACKKVWGVPLVDQYSCQEAGYLALQCPDHEHYHLQSENALVEILNEKSQPCAPGEIGRVVVTTLHNYASPFIRYDIGDYAQVGEPCACGRGLPVITRILGRVRNMLVLPSGESRWPLVGSDHYRHIAPISQFQLIQHAPDQIEVKMVMPRKLTAVEESALSNMICDSLGYPFRLTYTYVEHITRSAGGKYEDFISKISP